MTVEPDVAPVAPAPVAPAPAPAGPAVGVRGLSHAFDSADGQVDVLTDIDLAVGAGEFVALVGPSGCGKTTLLNLVSGIEAPQSGEVLVGGAPPRVGSPHVGYLFARDALLPWRTVLANAELALEMARVPRPERRERALAMLADVGLAGFAGAYPAQLSHGMRQRAAIARTLVARPDLLLLDEPFSALDAQTKLVLQETFTALWTSSGSTVVLITHDLAEAIALADRVVLMTARPGRIKRVLAVDLPRPRSVLGLQGDDRFHRIYEELWAELRDEVVGA